MALTLAAPVHLAAIDAGSNAIRLVIARAASPNDIRQLETQRVAVRLGHNAFTRHELDGEILRRAAKTFTRFRAVMERCHVVAYRAVATSAAREVRNLRALTERVRRRTGIDLEVVTGAEEARLVRAAVLNALGPGVSPRLIFDLGGGSLELSFLSRRAVEQTIGLPLGTVRLLETYHLNGPISEDVADQLCRHVLSMLSSARPSPPDLSRAIAVACGGNAEALAQLAPGPRFLRFPTLNLRLLRERLWQILRLDVPGRMKAFGVRRDRAEVMGMAAIVLVTLGRWLRLRSLLVPGVGVRDGLLLDLVAAQYSPEALSREERERAKVLLAGAQWFARRVNYNARHAEQVRRLAVALFDQFRQVHRLEPELRLVLEMAAVLHDTGHFVNRKSHHRHGEYLVRNAEIPGLRGWRRDMVACLVRYHNNKEEPSPNHRSYRSLDSGRRKQVRRLCALLRIAEELDSDHRQGVVQLDIEMNRRTAVFRVQTQDGAQLDPAEVLRKAGLFEREFHVKVAIRRGRQAREKVA